MQQIKPYSDYRWDLICSYCGKYPDTRDHVPSKILLDSPFPENLPVVPCCSKCNGDFSLDEEYFACLIECILCGTAEPKNLKRIKVKNILKSKPALNAQLKASMSCTGEKILFKPDTKRIENVLLKLARGHARFENSEAMLRPPVSMWYKPMVEMASSERERFFKEHEQHLWPEVGSRALFRVVENESGNRQSYWIEVQTGNYNYSVSIVTGLVIVRLIIHNYLAAMICWE